MAGEEGEGTSRGEAKCGTTPLSWTGSLARQYPQSRVGEYVQTTGLSAQTPRAKHTLRCCFDTSFQIMQASKMRPNHLGSAPCTMALGLLRFAVLGFTLAWQKASITMSVTGCLSRAPGTEPQCYGGVCTVTRRGWSFLSMHTRRSRCCLELKIPVARVSHQD